MEFKLANDYTFQQYEIYWTYTYWYYRQFPNVNRFPGMIVYAQAVEPFLSSHAAWIGDNMQYLWKVRSLAKWLALSNFIGEALVTFLWAIWKTKIYTKSSKIYSWNVLSLLGALDFYSGWVIFRKSNLEALMMTINYAMTFKKATMSSITHSFNTK